METSWRRPCDSSPAGRSATSLSSSSVRTRSRSASDARLPTARGESHRRRSRAPMRSSYSSICWNVRPSPARTRWCGRGRRAPGRRGGSIPMRRAKPLMASSSVVLPAPLGPMSADDAALGDVEAHVVDGDDAAVAHAHVVRATAARGSGARRAARLDDVHVATGSGSTGRPRRVRSFSSMAWIGPTMPSGFWITVSTRPTPVMVPYQSPRSSHWVGRRSRRCRRRRASRRGCRRRPT